MTSAASNSTAPLLLAPVDKTPPAPPALGQGICVACHGDLSKENKCKRCGADNTGWIKWKKDGPEHPSRAEQLKWLAANFWLDVVFLAACLLLVGAVGLRTLWVAWKGLGLLFFVVALVLSIGAAYEQWRHREAGREAAQLKEVTSAIVDKPKGQLPDLPVLFWMLIFGAVVSALGPLLFLSLRRLGFVDVPKPTIWDLVNVYLAMLNMYVLVIVGETWGRYALLPVYANHANPAAPPFVFAHPTKFLELAQEQIRKYLPDNEREAVLNWGDLKRRQDGGMDMEVTIDAGSKTVVKLLNGKSTTKPVEKTYLVRLDKWARVVTMTQQKKD